jgi:hypothetical protein
MLAEGVHRPIPCRTDGKWLPNAGPEQPRGGGERPGLPPALLRKRCLSSCLNAAAVDPRSQAHAALRCPSLSLLGPSCCEAHGSLGDQVWRWLSAEGAENGHFAFCARDAALHGFFSITPISIDPSLGRLGAFTGGRRAPQVRHFRVCRVSAPLMPPSGHLTVCYLPACTLWDL